jgi:hypothetical protein
MRDDFYGFILTLEITLILVEGTAIEQINFNALKCICVFFMIWNYLSVASLPNFLRRLSQSLGRDAAPTPSPLAKRNEGHGG